MRMGGIISTLKEISTKKGDRMAFATLEDLQGQTELILFPEVYRQSIELVKSEQPLYVIGKVDVGEDQAKIIAEKVCYLDQADSMFEGKVHIHIDASDMKDEDLNQLKTLLTKYKGNCYVILHMTIAGKSQTTLSLPRDYVLRPSMAFIAELQSLIPSSRIHLQ